MKKIKGFSFIVLGILVVLSSIFFVGCKADKDYEDLFVFATKGGKVQVNNTDVVTFGDEGKKFTFEENSKIELKAIADTGYKFVKWEYTDALNEQPEGFSTQAEITITLEDEVVIRAVFEVDANEKFDISYTSSGEGYNIVAEEGYDTSVVVGSTFKFKVELDEEYSYSRQNLLVKYNGIKIDPDHDVDTINNINTDITITVEGVKKNEYKVTIPTGEGYTITVAEGYNIESVVYGNDFKFSIDVDDKYEGYTIKCNSSEISAQDGVYTISNITSNCVITVELGQVKPTIYNVSKNVDSAGYNIIADEMSVTAGQTFEFGIQVLEGYVQDETNGITVTANNGDVEVEKNSDGTYYIENVNQNIVISVSGIFKIYKFNFVFENAELLEMIAGAAENIPEAISLEVVPQTEEKTYDIATFYVNILDESGDVVEIISMIDLINGIKEDLSNLAYSELIGFKYADSDFITFDDKFVTINWQLLSEGFEHEVIVVTSPTE